jgi:hypothetical protein
MSVIIKNPQGIDGNPPPNQELFDRTVPQYSLLFRHREKKPEIVVRVNVEKEKKRKKPLAPKSGQTIKTRPGTLQTSGPRAYMSVAFRSQVDAVPHPTPVLVSR